MLYAIISDIHANAEALKTVLDAIDKEKIERIVCLGDVVGYNASPNECINILKERDIPTILGNHDAVACELEEPWGFNAVALPAILWTRRELTEENREWLQRLPDTLNFGDFAAVHGAPKNHNTYIFTWEDVPPFLYFFEEQNVTLCFYGHTHIPSVISSEGTYSIDEDGTFKLKDGKTYFINPGSVGQPRDGDARASFGILDTETITYRQIRIEYNIEVTAQQVLEASLHPFLAERLHHGR
ncbi:MAG TPA: metallophosphoesterase family protein [Candidatus Hydrogenedens sp.]|nr:metallophosphatase family protein [Candidatus Hydrogenedens sp.]HOK08515.1 metallophosphoesterase family protein [Candidatus Hydrogenedens sp.]HOL19003.1 metallophosphoesterase family protein [Candidatus Hydrogenedens sp.]HPP57815.1 metallophosphoesterase family protein [Candidatus Hydrogenedens sp.]